MSEELVRLQMQQAQRLASIASKLIDTVLDRLRQLFESAWQRPVDVAEALEFLNANPQLLSFELLDEAIASDFKIRLVVNSALRIAGTIIRTKNGWAEQWVSGGTQLLKQILAIYRPDVYELLKDKENLIRFLHAYITYKLGLAGGRFDAVT